MTTMTTQLRLAGGTMTATVLLAGASALTAAAAFAAPTTQVPLKQAHKGMAAADAPHEGCSGYSGAETLWHFVVPALDAGAKSAGANITGITATFDPASTFTSQVVQNGKGINVFTTTATRVLDATATVAPEIPEEDAVLVLSHTCVGTGAPGGSNPGGSTGSTTGSSGSTTGSTGNGTTGSTGNGTTGSTGNGTTGSTGNGGGTGTTGSTGNGTTGSTGNGTTGSTGNGTTGSTGNGTTGSTGNGTTGSTGNGTTGSTGNGTTGSTGNGGGNGTTGSTGNSPVDISGGPVTTSSTPPDTTPVLPATPVTSLPDVSAPIAPFGSPSGAGSASVGGATTSAATAGSAASGSAAGAAEALPFTGAPVGLLLLYGFGTALTGAVLLASTRRRERAAAPGPIDLPTPPIARAPSPAVVPSVLPATTVYRGRHVRPSTTGVALLVLVSVSLLAVRGRRR